jgi:hypothetical protein
MSCENTNARLQIKYTTVAGQVPTIPSTNDHNDGTWNPTDIYIGEFFLNSYDDLLWVRTLDGILAVGGTGGSASFIGDFVSKANGGTYSGPVFGPTFSAINMIATTISASAFDGLIFGSSGSTYYGDGSNLTGITTVWNGGVVTNPSEFTDFVQFPYGIEVANIGNGGFPIYVNDDTVFSGGVDASYFIGDGSLLTNLPIGPTANDYTTNAYLDGNIIRYDRTDLADAYSVDLSPILFTQSVSSFAWDSATNDATIYINDGSFYTINLGIFNNISTAIINATDVYATNFYGTFNGTYSNDIYTTSASLVGTTAVFDRTDGITYSLDLSTFSGGGTGSAGTLEQTLVLGNTIGTQSINFGGTAYIDADGTNIRLKADGNVSGDLYLNSLIVYDNTAFGPYGVEQISFSSVAGVDNTSSIELSPGQTYEAHVINDIVTGTQQNTSISRTPEKTLELLIDQSTGVDTEYRRELGVIGTTNGSSVKVTDNNSLEETEIKTDKSAITLSSSAAGGASASKIIVAHDYITNRVDASVGTGTGPFTLIEQTYTDIIVSGTPSFPGITYDRDYSANYTNRSLVDKEYVDNLPVGATQTLAQTLVYGNETSATDILLSNSVFAGTSDNIRAAGNLFADAQFTYEDYGGGYWAPSIRVNEGSAQNYIIVGSQSTIIQNNLINEYSKITVDPLFLNLMVNDLTTASGSNINMTSTTIAYNIEDASYFSASGSVACGLGIPTSFGNDYIAPNPGFPDFHRRGSVNMLSGPASGQPTYAELDSRTTDGSSYAFIRATDLGGAYPANVFETGGSSGYYSQIEQSPNYVILESSNPAFEGFKYDTDWSANFVARSLVDKAYVDAAVSGIPGTPTLAAVLLVGNQATSHIDMNGYDIQNVQTIDATNVEVTTIYADPTTGIETINMLNMSLLALMYNT